MLQSTQNATRMTPSLKPKENLLKTAKTAKTLLDTKRPATAKKGGILRDKTNQTPLRTPAVKPLKQTQKTTLKPSKLKFSSVVSPVIKEEEKDETPNVEYMPPRSVPLPLDMPELSVDDELIAVVRRGAPITKLNVSTNKIMEPLTFDDFEPEEILIQGTYYLTRQEWLII